MVVCAGRSGERLRTASTPSSLFLQFSGHTTTQPSSLEEEGGYFPAMQIAAARYSQGAGASRASMSS
jgi:hypothetical protein